MRAGRFPSARLGLALIVALVVAPAGYASAQAPPKRLAVAVLTFENRTGDPAAVHWQYTASRYLTKQLKHVKAVRVLPRESVKYAMRQVAPNPPAPPGKTPDQATMSGPGLSTKPETDLSTKAKASSGPDPATIRRAGEIMEAQRVVWGYYRREGGTWRAEVFVMNVATGKSSAALTASDPSWLNICGDLAGQVLRELDVTPTQEERERLERRGTRSTVALDAFSQACWLAQEHKPLAEQEALLRKAIEADPQYADAYAALAAVLGTQGKGQEAEQRIREAMGMDPDEAMTWVTLGVCLLFQEKLDEASKTFEEALRLDPDEAEIETRLGEVARVRDRRPEEVTHIQRAARLNPFDAGAHASLGFTYVLIGEREKALAELREAERLDPEDVSALQMQSIGYDRLGETALAIDHYERFVLLTRRQGTNPEMIGTMEERGKYLKGTLAPSFVEAAMPKVYSETELREALRAKLSPDELGAAVDPMATTDEMRRFAEDLTRGAGTDLEKAKAVYEGLVRRPQEGKGGIRTAKEVFAAWTRPSESFSCQEYARLFIALARSVGVKAFYVHLERDYQGKVVYHDCAAVFADGKALLVDPAYRWFGPPHKQYLLLDDVQTAAHLLYQPPEIGDPLRRCRIAVKLDPDSAWGRMALVRALGTADRWKEVREELDTVDRLEPNRWDSWLFHGLLALHEDRMTDAVNAFEKALVVNPEDSDAHYNLAGILRAQNRLMEAREHYRACLRYDPEPDMAADCQRQIAAINEKLGTE